MPPRKRFRPEELAVVFAVAETSAVAHILTVCAATAQSVVLDYHKRTGLTILAFHPAGSQCFRAHLPPDLLADANQLGTATSLHLSAANVKLVAETVGKMDRAVFRQYTTSPQLFVSDAAAGAVPLPGTITVDSTVCVDQLEPMDGALTPLARDAFPSVFDVVLPLPTTAWVQILNDAVAKNAAYVEMALSGTSLVCLWCMDEECGRDMQTTTVTLPTAITGTCTGVRFSVPLLRETLHVRPISATCTVYLSQQHGCLCVSADSPAGLSMDVFVPASIL